MFRPSLAEIASRLLKASFGAATSRVFLDRSLRLAAKSMGRITVASGNPSREKGERALGAGQGKIKASSEA